MSYPTVYRSSNCVSCRSGLRKLNNLIQARVVPAPPKNEDFRLSAPARPRDAPAAPRPAPGTSIGRLDPPRRAIRADQVSHGAKKGYFSTFFRRWGRENTLCAAIVQRGGWRRPIDVPGPNAGRWGRHRHGGVGAERRKSSFSLPPHNYQ